MVASKSLFIAPLGDVPIGETHPSIIQTDYLDEPKLDGIGLSVAAFRLSLMRQANGLVLGSSRTRGSLSLLREYSVFLRPAVSR
jgi:hypothetical protein